MTEKQYPELHQTIRDSLKDCALGDSAYAAGMLLGWNLCTDGRDEDFRRIREDRLRAAASASKEAQEAAPQPQEAEPSTNTYVQQVPDKCDRIAWRGHYYHLPIKAAPSQDAEDRSSLAQTLRTMGKQAYRNYVEQMRRDECLGWEQKVKTGSFTWAELKGHTKASEQLGRYRAFYEAARAQQETHRD